MPIGGALRVGLELLEVGDEQDHLDQLVEAQAGLGRDGHERHVAAVLLDDDAGLGQLGLDPVGVGVRLVDLVERDDDRHLGRLGVADRLERLGHDAVVGRDHDDRDVGHPGAAGAHRGERLVARRVEEDDALAVVGDLARADVLGDAAALAGRDLGRPDGVEQAGLAVVDVAHDGHDRGARLRVSAGSSSSKRTSLVASAGLALALGVGAVGAGAAIGLGDLVAELAGDERRGVAVDQLVDGREDAALDQLADDVGRVDGEQLGELLDGDRAGQLDRAALARVERPGPGDALNAPSRRGGLRGPRRPRVPLLLLATGSSFDGRVSGIAARPTSVSRRSRRERGSRAPVRGRPC